MNKKRKRKAQIQSPQALLGQTLLRHFCLKYLGMTIFICLFFVAYIYLLKHPQYPVTTMPLTEADRLIGVQPIFLPVYLSLWLFLAIPLILMRERKEIHAYGFWMLVVCGIGLAVFYWRPTAVPPNPTDWSRYWGMAFLRGADAAGNACPSLHVATTVLAAVWLARDPPHLLMGKHARSFSLLWAAAIIYSALATKQHVLWDAVGGVGLGLLVAFFASLRLYRQQRVALTLP